MPNSILKSIPDGNFISWDHDHLNRRSAANILKTAIEKSDGPVTIQIDAPYGSGKSFFLEGLRADLETENYSVIWYNSWENDLLENPAFSLFEHFAEKISELAPPNSIEKVSQFKTLGVDLILGGLGGLVPGTGGVAALLRDYAKRRINMIDESRRSPKYLRDCLEEIAQSLQFKKLVVIIDELDRARPNFAIGVIEALKHLFWSKGVVFLVAVDSSVLENAIIHEYGRIDANAYLRRVFNFVFSLPIEDKSEYIRRRLEQLDLKGAADNATTNLKEIERILVSLDQFLALSLRDLNRIITDFNFIFYFSTNNWIVSTILFCLAMRIKRRADLFSLTRAATWTEASINILKEIKSNKKIKDPAYLIFPILEFSVGDTDTSYVTKTVDLISDQRFHELPDWIEVAHNQARRAGTLTKISVGLDIFEKVEEAMRFRPR